jgi:hypothetical protein
MKSSKNHSDRQGVSATFIRKVQEAASKLPPHNRLSVSQNR